MCAWPKMAFWALALMVAAGLSWPAQAKRYQHIDSTLDANLMAIDEKKFLGSKISPETRLVDHTGRAFTWADMLGKPTILVLSYYTCDGSCSIINQALADLLKGVKAVRPGEDFNILTLSFDRHDTLQTTGTFRQHVELTRETGGAWTFGTFADENELKAETERIGFRFFWEPRDRIFLHPGAFLFFSPEGRLIRVLYQQEVSARDVELAILDAKGSNYRPGEILNLALSLCYSYSYTDGKYHLSIPVFVGVGSFLLGLALLAGSLLIYRLKYRKHSLGDGNHAETA